MNTTTKLLAAASLITSMFLANSSLASDATSKLEVKNETGEKLHVIVEPGLGSVPKHKESIEKTVENGKAETIEVTKNAHFTEHFSVTGKRDEHAVKDAASVIKHTCQHLKLPENYQVIFTKNSVGQIECKHHEVK